VVDGIQPGPGENYIDTWVGTVSSSGSRTTTVPSRSSSGSGSRTHDPWDAPAEYVDRYRKEQMPMPDSLTRPEGTGRGTIPAFLDFFLNVYSDHRT